MHACHRIRERERSPTQHPRPSPRPSESVLSVVFSSPVGPLAVGNEGGNSLPRANINFIRDPVYRTRLQGVRSVCAV